jgi:hypothetical protein
MANTESNQSDSISDLMCGSSSRGAEFEVEEMDGGYFSDDLEMRLRTLAPVCCRICQRFIGRRSIVTGKPVIECGRLSGETETAEVLNNMLFNMARRHGECHEMRPMRGLLP